MRPGIHVVRGGIAVLDLNRLSDKYTKDMRLVLAARLIEHHGRRRRRVDTIAESVADVHEDVGDVAFLVNNRRFRERRSDVSAGEGKGMLGLAEGITTHANDGTPWRLA